MAATAPTTEVNSAPPSPVSSTSSASATPLAPRPVHLAASGLWKPTPKLTQNFSLPLPLPEPALTQTTIGIPSITSAPVALTSTPKSSPSPTPPLTLKTTTSPAKLLPSPTLPAHSILRPGDIHPAVRPAGTSPTASSSTSSSSLNNMPKTKGSGPPLSKNNNRRSRAKSIKEGAFFAFVLLPLSCWYTRGGKRLGGGGAKLGDGEGGRGGKGMGGGRKGEMVEWDGGEYAEYEVLEQEDGMRSRGRELPELRRPVYGRRDSLGQVGGGGKWNGSVVGRRQSFTAPVPAGVVVGHGRSNSFSTGTFRGSGSASGFGMQRREVADYGVDRGAAAVYGEWDLDLERERELARERDGEFERLRLSRQKSRGRTGSPVPLRRRSEV